MPFYWPPAEAPNYLVSSGFAAGAELPVVLTLVAAWLQLVFAAAPWQLVLEAAAALAQLVLATEPPLVVVVVAVLLAQQP